MTFPNVKNNAGPKQHGPCFLRRRRRPKAGDAFTRTRLMPTFGVSAALLLNIAGCRKAMFRERPAEGPKVGVWGVRVFRFRVLRVFRVFRAYGLGSLGCSLWGSRGWL